MSTVTVRELIDTLSLMLCKTGTEDLIDIAHDIRDVPVDLDVRDFSEEWINVEYTVWVTYPSLDTQIDVNYAQDLIYYVVVTALCNVADLTEIDQFDTYSIFESELNFNRYRKQRHI